MNDNSDELVQRATKGDALAVDMLIERHLPGLQAYVRRHVGQLVQAKRSSKRTTTRS